MNEVEEQPVDIRYEQKRKKRIDWYTHIHIQGRVRNVWIFLSQMKQSTEKINNLATLYNQKQQRIKAWNSKGKKWSNPEEEINAIKGTEIFNQI